MTLGENLRARLALGGVEDFGQAQHFERAGAIGQAADEAALLERQNQPVNPGLRAQIERVLHLVERGRHARLLQPLMNEAQEIALFFRQHRQKSPGSHGRIGLQPPEGDCGRRS